MNDERQKHFRRLFATNLPPAHVETFPRSRVPMPLVKMMIRNPIMMVTVVVRTGTKTTGSLSRPEITI